MRKGLKYLAIILMIVGITLSVLNFISVDNMAEMQKPGSNITGTYDPVDQTCTGASLNC